MATMAIRSEPDVPDYMNERVFQRNRLAPRAYSLPVTHVLLNGKWKFHYARSPLDPEPSAGNPGAWSLIDVPGHFQTQGYGHPHYTNFDYPWPTNPPYVPSENPTGLYEMVFSVPDHWDIDGGYKYRLRFEGVDSAFHLWVNGKEVGYSQGSRNPAEFDISDVVRHGVGETNKLKVKVYQWSDGSYIEDQDMWWLSGIYRDVSLLAYPQKGHVEDFFIRTELDKEYKNAILNTSLVLELASAASVTMTLIDANGQITSPPQSWDISADTTTPSCNLNISDPLKWTAEHPYLYELRISLSADGQVLQEIIQKVGFRQIELKDGLVQVNGKPVHFRGVNRHDHHPRFGRAVPLEFIKHDLCLMKQHNVNALRCSHYPNDPRLVAFANEIGLYVMDEADLECHGMGYDLQNLPSDSPAWTAAYLDRMHQLVHRDKNNPSVIIWSLGNESYFGQNHVAMYQWSKKYDPTRLVHYEGDHSYQASDIASSMYNSHADLVNLGDTDQWEKPVLLQEYGHAMGNGPGALKEYQDIFYKYRRLQGGFIWEWANHGLLKKLDDGSGKSFYAYGGDFGDEPNDKNFVMDGLCTSEHLPGPGLVELKKVYQPIEVNWIEDGFYIKNRYDFISLKDLDCTWTILRFAENGDEQQLASKTSRLHEIAPGSVYQIRPLKQDNIKFDVKQPETWLRISFKPRAHLPWADCGHEIAWAEFHLSPDTSFSQLPIIRNLQNPSIQQGGRTLSIITSTFAMVFDRIQAKILKWSYKGQDLICQDAGPRLTFWRAPTDNDKPNAANVWRGWGLNHMMHEVRSVKHGINEESGALEIFVKSWIAPPVLAWGFETRTTYTIHGDGKLLIHVHASPKGSAPGILPRVGFEMLLPEDREYAQWFGLGPGQSYKDMKESGKIGVWKRSLKDMMVNYEMPQENGNRTETRWVKVIDERGIGVKAALQHNQSDSTLHSKASKAVGNDATKVARPQTPPSPLQAWEMVPQPHQQDMQTASRPGFDFAVSKYTAADLDQAQHPHELQGSEGVVFRIDDDHHGLGSASCGPDTLDQYQLKMREFNFTVSIEATGI